MCPSGMCLTFLCSGAWRTAVIIGVIHGLQKACNWRGWGWVKMFSELA